MWGWIKKTAKKVWRGVRGAARFLGRVVYTVIARILGIPELLLSLLGLRLKKYMELSVIILKSNNKPLATVAEVQAVVDEAKRVFLEQANVRLRQPSVYDAMVRERQGSNPAWVLNPKCNVGAFKHMFTRVGGWYESERANGGVTIFVVEDVQGGLAGCHIGPFAAWGYIDPDALRDSSGAPATGGRALTLAHELGHSCQLPHKKRRDNLMVAGQSRRNEHLVRWQIAWLRSSYRVHYFSWNER